jgi:hypothetical protein
MREVCWVDSRLRPPPDAVGDCEGNGVILGWITPPTYRAHEESILSAIRPSLPFGRGVLRIDGNAKGVMKLRIEVVGIFCG